MKYTNQILNEWIQGATFSIVEDTNSLLNAVYDGTAAFRANLTGVSSANLEDFDIGTPSNGDVIVYNSTSGKWENSEYDIQSLENLSDVSVAGLTGGDRLVYNGTSGKWENTVIPAGTSGTSGSSGLDGTSGVNGADGTSGTSGSSGLDGTSGVNGADGTSGIDGTSGVNGADGTSGVDGASGSSGTSGVSGSSGVNGADGTSGTSGVSGSSGSSGVSGSSGSSGTSGVSGTSGTSSAGGTKAFQTLTDAATITWNYANGYNAKVTLGGNRALSISNAADGDYGTLIVKQDATGSRRINFGANDIFCYGTYSFTTTGTASDVFSFVYDGSKYYWTSAPDFK